MITQDFTVDQEGPVVVASFSPAQLGVGLMQEVVDELMQRLRCDNAFYFVFDLGPVEFLPSPCINVMLQFLQEVEHVRGRIAVARCRPNIAYTFKITRLDGVFHLYDDVADARAGIVRG